MRLILFLFIILSITVSCSGPSKKEPAIKIIQTPMRFETEEQYLRRKALESYRQMRIDAIVNPKKYRKYRTRKKSFKKKFQQPAFTRKKPKNGNDKLTPTPFIMYGEMKEKLKRRKEDREVEIMQNIDFYCIKKQGNSEFKSTSECKEFGLSMLLECENEIDDGFYRADQKLIYCVKSKLSL